MRRLIFLLSLIAGFSHAAAQKRNITEKDLFDFVWIGDPQISPDGMRVAFVRVTVNEKREGYNTSIWSVPVADGEVCRHGAQLLVLLDRQPHALETVGVGALTNEVACRDDLAEVTIELLKPLVDLPEARLVGGNADLPGLTFLRR